MKSNTTKMLLFYVYFFILLLPWAQGTPITNENHRPRSPSFPPQPSVTAVVAFAGPDEHVFARNQLADVSWENPKLLISLYTGTGSSPPPVKRKVKVLSKRAGSTIGPVFQASHCLGCKEHNEGDQMTIGQLTEDFIQQNSFFYGREGDLRDKCIFYTGVTRQDLENDENAWVRNEPETRLSRHAAAMACRNGKESIWSIFPGEHQNAPPSKEPDSEQKRNMFELDRDGGWLHFLNGNPSRFTYFERMSTVMARMCQGIVIVMSLDPENIHEYGTGSRGDNNEHSIWNNFERPALGRNSAVTKVYAVHARNPTMGYEMDFRTTGVIAKNSDEIPVPGMSMLKAKRDGCVNGQSWEISGEDWFGTGRTIT